MSKYKNTVSGILLFTFLLSVNFLFALDQKTVLIDENHGQVFKTSASGELDLSSFSQLLQKEGWIVKTSKAEITEEVLKEVDALIITGAFSPVSQAEIEAIIHFIEKGGKLSVMLHIGFPVADLLHALDVSISNGIIHEKENIILDNDIEFKVVDLKPHELTKHLNQFSLHGGWALLPTKKHAQMIAQTSENAWIDLNGDHIADAQQAFATMVVGSMGSGHFVVFSDDAIFQNKFLKENNYLLGENLARWLMN